MKVLIADFDLFSNVGGGQTVYRSLVEKNPDIEFYYLIRSERYDSIRPGNTHGIPYKEYYSMHEFNWHECPSNWAANAFVEANNIAISTAESRFKRFDVIDVPDYTQYGAFMRQAMKHHGVDAGRIALSLHGRISTSIKMDWSNEYVNVDHLEMLEQIQYRTVDMRYGISESYIAEWQTITGLDACYISPLQFMEFQRPVIPHSLDGLPTINFIGRTEKRKGPDIFVELASWLSRSHYSSANIIGPDNGKGSTQQISQMISNRCMDISLKKAMSHDELDELFADRTIVFLPSRYDTFNLIALESLFSGCPTAIGSGAGVYHFLMKRFPHIPFIKIDMRNIYESIKPICAVLQNYGAYRERLVDSVRKSRLVDIGPSIESLYNCHPVSDASVNDQIEKMYYQMMRLRRGYIWYYLNKASSDIKPDRRNILLSLKTKLTECMISKRTAVTEEMMNVRFLYQSYREVLSLPENTDKQVKRKLKMYWYLASHHRIDRIRLWSEIARLERLRGNNLIAATYDLRIMRSHGEDRFGQLPSLITNLNTCGFSQESIVAQAMFGQEDMRLEHCTFLLENAKRVHAKNPERTYDLIDDRRKSTSYRVSVIVSLYNAAAKLPLFLRLLNEQSMFKSSNSELIIVETGSSDADYRVFNECISSLDIPVVYARSDHRETIQSAWNRGIALSRAPYLTFLGVDETIVPDCLEILAAELDMDPSVDWVQGNSVINMVDSDGALINDIMCYDRTGYNQDLVYLDTCYLSWVGALYRRSIHDHFGYYDASFSAAGDTEFKNRVLPFIKSRSISMTLGRFLNYPDDRTTQSPRAEIEDLRAWYLHRSLAGVKYAFSARSTGDIEALFYKSLNYRKSFCQHMSTDVEFAYNMATFIQEQKRFSPVLQYLSGVKEVLDVYRSLDQLPKLSPAAAMSKVMEGECLTSCMRKRQQTVNPPIVQPAYYIFNDNRYEQHSNVWKSNV